MGRGLVSAGSQLMIALMSSRVGCAVSLQGSVRKPLRTILLSCVVSPQHGTERRYRTALRFEITARPQIMEDFASPKMSHPGMHIMQLCPTYKASVLHHR